MQDVLRNLLTRYYALLDKKLKIMGYPMSPQEAMFMHSLVLREHPAVIFECGTAVGWCASWMAAASDAPVFSYDIVRREQFFNDNFVAIIGTFDIQVHTEIAKWRGKKKLILIDGDHSLNGVMADFNAVVPYCEPGDIIVLHDTKLERGVVRALQQIRATYPSFRYESIDTRNGIEVITCG